MSGADVTRPKAGFYRHNVQKGWLCLTWISSCPIWYHTRHVWFQGIKIYVREYIYRCRKFQLSKQTYSVVDITMLWLDLKKLWWLYNAWLRSNQTSLVVCCMPSLSWTPALSVILLWSSRTMKTSRLCEKVSPKRNEDEEHTASTRNASSLIEDY